MYREAGLTTIEITMNTPDAEKIIKYAVEHHREALHGMVHNTGGAQTKCLKYFSEPVRIIKDNLFEPPLIFSLIQEASGISYQEMYQVFNMGTRLEIYTDAATAEAIIKHSRSLNVEAQIVGRVEAADQKEVVVRSRFGEFVYRGE